MSNHPEYPIEYKTKSVRFFGRDFFVDENVLIPRLETEFLVRRARQYLQDPKYLFHNIIDIGTGSGIVWLSLCDFALPTVLVDISQEALQGAKKNAKKLFPEAEYISFLQNNLIENIKIPNNTLLVANLPYVKKNDFENMSDDTMFEPSLALFGWEKTGFELYEKLFFLLSKQNPVRSMGIFEFWFDQKNIAREVLERYNWKYAFFSDHAGIERFVEVWF